MNKQYGKYAGVLETDKEGKNIVLSGDEINLYFIINTFGGIIWRANHDSADGRITLNNQMVEDLKELQYAIEFAVLNSRRFGVEIPEPKEGEHVTRTDSYSKWFKWWNNYVESLPEEEWQELNQAISNKADLSKYRPEGDWK